MENKIIQTDYLVIGNSAAGIGTVQGIRSIDRSGSIVLLSDEAHHTYSRPLISYWLQGRVEPQNMIYRDLDFYADYGVQALLGPDAKVISLDPQAGQALLENGDIVEYGRLMIASGSVPFVPPMKGLEEAQDDFTFTKLADAEGVKAIVDAMAEKDQKPKTVILGAGLIGLKAAEALADQAESIVVVDLAERVLPSVLTENTAPFVQDYLEEQGLVFRLGRSFAQIGDHEVTLSDGETLPYDILILAAGTRPNVVFAKEAGIECGRGILTDEHQQTNLENIFAAGDCTDSMDISTGSVKNMAILPNAFMQGKTAGITMAGGEAVYDKGFPVNSLGLLGLFMLSAGSYTGNEVIVEGGDCTKHFFVSEDGTQLNGFIIFGDCPRAGIYTDLIREKTDLSGIDMERLFAEPGIMAFGHQARINKLARPH
ncbi:MAG: NAD(P)/FAD-dependent oxidoreductase [Eubacteriaceae bacterium]|jgi:NAD(P)H-nitrite reductase large subunit